jgi:hypothetical protein
MAARSVKAKEVSAMKNWKAAGYVALAVSPSGKVFPFRTRRGLVAFLKHNPQWSAQYL